MQLMVQLGLNASGFESGLKRSKSAATAFGSDLQSYIGSKISSVFGAVALEETIRRTVEYGSKVQDLSNRLGISTDAVQRWSFAMEQNGGSIEQAARFFERLAVSREKALRGNEDQINAFRRLGITLDTLKTSRLEDVAGVIARAFESGDPQALIAPLRKVGGKGAAAMAAAFADGLGDALKAAPIIDAESIAALDRAADTFTELKNAARAAFAPIIADAMELVLHVKEVAENLVALPAGALRSVIESFQNLDLSSGGGFLKSLGSAVFGVAKTAVGGAKEGFDAMREAHANDAKAREEKKLRDAQKKGPLDLDADDAADKKLMAKMEKESDDQLDKEWNEMVSEAKKKLRDQDREDRKSGKMRASLFRPEGDSLRDIGNMLGGVPDRTIPDKLDVLHNDLNKLITQSKDTPAGLTFPST